MFLIYVVYSYFWTYGFHIITEKLRLIRLTSWSGFVVTIYVSVAKKNRPNGIFIRYSFSRHSCTLFSSTSYYMARSVSGQDDPNRALWLATRAGKWSHLARSGLPAIPQEQFPRKPYNKSFIDQVCSAKMAGYWPCFFASWCSSRSINT